MRWASRRSSPSSVSSPIRSGAIRISRLASQAATVGFAARDRGLAEFDLVDVRSFSKDGTTRAVYGYRAVEYDLPRGNAAGYMPELNVLCGIADVSTQSEQPVTKHLVVEVTPAQES